MFRIDYLKVLYSIPSGLHSYPLTLMIKSQQWDCGLVEQEA